MYTAYDCLDHVDHVETQVHVTSCNKPEQTKFYVEHCPASNSLFCTEFCTNFTNLNKPNFTWSIALLQIHCFALNCHNLLTTVALKGHDEMTK